MAIGILSFVLFLSLCAVGIMAGCNRVHKKIADAAMDACKYDAVMEYIAGRHYTHDEKIAVLTFASHLLDVYKDALA